MTDIDEMTLDEFKAEIEGMVYVSKYDKAPAPWKCGSLIILSPDNYRFREVFLANTELDAARAALRWLREREGK